MFMQPKHLSTEAITCAVKSHPAVRLQTEATLLVEKMGHFNFWLNLSFSESKVTLFHANSTDLS